MARLAGVDIPREKRVEVALTYIYGVGKTRATETLQATGIDPDTRVRNLTDDQLVALRDHIEGTYKVEGARSTGSFKGASGSGKISLLFTANLPKKSNGTCNISSSAVPRASSARVSFAARGPMTVK